MRGTGHGREPACNNRLAIHWAGALSIAAFAAGVTLAILKIEAAVIILVFGIPVTVVGGFVGYLGGRAAAAQQQSTQTGAIVNTTEPVDVQPPTGAPSGAGETT